MQLIQSQVQKLSHQQLQSIELLQMSTLELEAYIQELALDNPFVEVDESPANSQDPQDETFLEKLQWLDENDRQNHFYQHMSSEELDPLARIGTDGGLEETLFRFLSRQIHGLNLQEDTAQTVRYLAACLDDNGYFRMPLNELSSNLGIPLEHLEYCLTILRSLEPAGVGAENLSQCLALQLQRIGETGPALAIVQHYLEPFAKRHYRAIAAKLGIRIDQVQAAETIIRELDPKPGAIFQCPKQIPYIYPDIFVVENNGTFVVHSRCGDHPTFHLNAYYRNLLLQSDDQEVKEYLSTKLRQAENILWAIEQRENTLQRCAQRIVERQSQFFRLGPCALSPLRMSDIAQDLGLHESTISRTVREKYLQCTRGIYPLSYFFSRAATIERNCTGIGGTAARMLLLHLIDSEDKSHPLSDQKLSEQMAQNHCPISRRTVTKYREEMNIPGTSRRKHN